MTTCTRADGHAWFNYTFLTRKERDNETGLDWFGPGRYYSSTQGRFTSTDPLYIELRRLVDPQRLNIYSYTRNNPLRFIDPDGLDIKLNCDDKNRCTEAVQDLNNRKGAQFKVELKDGKLKVVGKVDQKKLSTGEKALFKAVSDKNNTATINVVANTGQSEFGTHDSKGVNTVDLGNLSQLDAASNKGGLNSGDVIAHEAMDAYLGLSMDENAADRAAAALYPGLYLPEDNKNAWNKTNTDVLGSTFTQRISDGRGSERISIRYITPIPGIDADPRFNSAERRNEIAHDAGSRVTGVTFVPKKP
ncbi:MAG: RHS repeat-associated core domain-containing protein [Pyrinomonadaceae bacterium]